MKKTLIFVFLALSFSGCQVVDSKTHDYQQTNADNQTQQNSDNQTQKAEVKSESVKKVLANARRQMEVTKSYDPAYTVIAYPNGDVAQEKGVCTDVVIRGLRAANVDLQKEVHEDMNANFAAYPKKWNLPKPDANIDHRRVPNLQTFFIRRGKSLPITDKSADYQAGDIVSWDLNGKGLTHIGLVSDRFDPQTKRPFIIHNIGSGAVEEDVLFEWKITGHFRYFN